MTTALQQLLNEHVDEEALSESSESLGCPEDMLHEALAEAAGIETPKEGEFDHLQTYNQDHLAGLSSEDISFLHPDNTNDLNAESAEEASKKLERDQRDVASSSFSEDTAAAPSLLQGLLEDTTTDAEDDEGDDFGLGDDDQDDTDTSYTSDDEE